MPLRYALAIPLTLLGAWLLVRAIRTRAAKSRDAAIVDIVVATSALFIGLIGIGLWIAE
jgi:hypothetical protein